jgi:hypothetical protein
LTPCSSLVKKPGYMLSMPSSEGLILDATALIDFCWLNE